MATTTLTTENFVETIQNNDIVLIDFWADWCGPCKMFAPVYDAESNKHEDIVFGKVDTEDQRELGGAMNISSIPTVMAFREGVMVFSQSGAMPPAMLTDLIKQIRELPMEKIHAEIAEQQAAEGDAAQQN
ncbi:MULTISPECIES: thioredoxin [Yimella]|uniref:Thioredoxin n=1 Tax=Yimella lutea TaxID=587872 RepID=A0A542EBQ3_9MICO|nr:MULTISPECIES: thioredoxin [Yimella]MCG8654159.1 thioredoxin [Yimella sp. NH-Cas1]RYG77317.1 thioredoxin [Yimella sp. RIT 621]TQJ12772.1 thioredoxin [Yimella lutea]